MNNNKNNIIVTFFTHTQKPVITRKSSADILYKKNKILTKSGCVVVYSKIKLPNNAPEAVRDIEKNKAKCLLIAERLRLRFC